MNRTALVDEIKKKKSLLCVGLDPDLKKIPEHLLDSEDPILEFNKAIIDATADLAIAYKPNIAFFESQGPGGWVSLQKTLEYIPDNIFKIADAKRGDIGNTSRMYATAFFEKLNSDAITISPYMGEDSVTPFLDFDGKWVILLAATSNQGGLDFQALEVGNSEKLYERVIRKSMEWSTPENMMYVVGATRPEALAEIRKIIPDHFLLIPGVGAQGGNLEEVCHAGLNDLGGLLINSSRGIIYAGSGTDFQDAARQAARKLQQQMEVILVNRGITL